MAVRSHFVSFVRSTIFLRVACILLGAFSIITVIQAPLAALHGGHAVDFLQLDAAAHIFRMHGCIYCLGTLRSEEIHLLGYTPRTGPFFPIGYLDPPPVAWLVQPFTYLPFPIGEAAYDLVVALGLLIGAYLLFKLLPAAWSVDARLCLTFLLGLPLWGTLCIVLGKYETLLNVAVLLSIVLWKKYPFAAGIVLALALAKPQIIYLAPFALLASRQWRCFLGFSLGGFLWLVFSVALLHGNFSHYIALLHYSGFDRLLEPSAPEVLQWYGLALAASIASVAGPLLTVAAMAWRRTYFAAVPLLALAFAMIASLTWTIHDADYDLLLVAAPLAIWAMVDLAPALTIAIALSVAYAIGYFFHIITPLEPLVLMAALALLIGRTAGRQALDQNPSLRNVVSTGST